LHGRCRRRRVIFREMSAYRVFALCSLFLGAAVTCAQEDGGQNPSVAARLKQEWSLHPGPLMLDAHNWLPDEVVIDGERVIREPDLSFIAMTSSRRYMRVGRADVFARRLKIGAGLSGGRAGSMWRFVSSRRDSLIKGMPLRELTSDEREVLMENTSMFPAFTRELSQGSSALLNLKVQFNWEQDGRQRSVFIDRIASPKIVGPPSGTPGWATARPLTSTSIPTLDFGEGRLLSVRLMLAKLSELGYTFRYDGRLEESPVFLKGEFEVPEFLEATREMLQTIPFFAEDRRSESEQKAATYREVLIQTMVANGVPPSLAERLDENFSIRANQQELLLIPQFREWLANEWAASENELVVRCRLVLCCDEESTWRVMRSDGISHTRSQFKYILAEPERFP
jgi:hypothetical protein